MRGTNHRVDFGETKQQKGTIVMEKNYKITVSSPDGGDNDKRHIVTHEVTGKGISPISCYTNAVRQVNEMIGDKEGHEIVRINGPQVTLTARWRKTPNRKEKNERTSRLD